MHKQATQSVRSLWLRLDTSFLCEHSRGRPFGRVSNKVSHYNSVWKLHIYRCQMPPRARQIRTENLSSILAPTACISTRSFRTSHCLLRTCDFSLQTRQCILLMPQVPWELFFIAPPTLPFLCRPKVHAQPIHQRPYFPFPFLPLLLRPPSPLSLINHLF